MPAPPSFVALPPIPRVMSRTPASSAARISSPVPRVVAPRGSSSSVASRDRPDAAAISMNARAPSVDWSQRAEIARPIGSVASATRHVQPPAASIATVVPSPPSARGASRIASRGRARAQPAASARATSTEVSDPLKESGAIRTTTGGGSTAPARAPADRGRGASAVTAGRVRDRRPARRRRRGSPRRSSRRCRVAARGTPGSGSSAGAPGPRAR